MSVSDNQATGILCTPTAIDGKVIAIWASMHAASADGSQYLQRLQP